MLMRRIAERRQRFEELGEQGYFSVVEKTGQSFDMSSQVDVVWQAVVEMEKRGGEGQDDAIPDF